TLMNCDSGGETCSATLGVLAYVAAFGSAAAGFAPPGLALTLTPARPSASMKAVRAKAAGLVIFETFKTGLASAASCPLMRSVPGPAASITSALVFVPAATVSPRPTTRVLAVFGRQSTRAGLPLA